MDGKWIVHGSRDVYDNEWARVSLADVELPDGTRFEHYYVTQPKCKGAAFVLAHDDQQRVLLIWRHRFITDDWTWELPGGGVEQNETFEQAAKREFEEETGWRTDKVELLTKMQPTNGFMNQPCEIFTTSSATWVGPHPDPNEAADIAWLSVDEILRLIDKGDVSSGFTQLGVLYAIAAGPLKAGR